MENRHVEKEQDASFMLPFTFAFWSLRVIRVPGEKDDNLGLVCIHMPAAAMNIIGLYGLRGGCSIQTQDTIPLCYACLACIVGDCHALAGFFLWRPEASAHDVSLCRLRQHKHVHQAKGKEGMTH